MQRINVWDYTDEGRKLAGWFNRDTAEVIEEATRWDGNNHVSVHTSDQFAHQRLILTSTGRWVLNSWSQWQGSEDLYEFVTDDKVKEWLLVNEDDVLVEKYFGELEEERGPGRPEIGKAINWRPGDDLLPRIDAHRQRSGQNRADFLRKVVMKGLDDIEADDNLRWDAEAGLVEIGDDFVPTQGSKGWTEGAA